MKGFRAVTILADVGQPYIGELCEEGAWIAPDAVGIHEPWDKVGKENNGGNCEA